jgi:hypothetical protein
MTVVKEHSDKQPLSSIRSIVIDEKGTLKASEYKKYENIAGSVLLSLFVGSNGNAYYCPRRLAPG